MKVGGASEIDVPPAPPHPASPSDPNGGVLGPVHGAPQESPSPHLLDRSHTRSQRPFPGNPTNSHGRTCSAGEIIASGSYPSLSLLPGWARNGLDVCRLEHRVDRSSGACARVCAAGRVIDAPGTCRV